MGTSFASTLRLAARLGLAGAVLAVTTAAAPAAPSGGRPDARAAAVIAHWTPERIRAAIHRDFVRDSRGLAYLKTPTGLVPHGHATPALPSDTAATKVWRPTPLDTIAPTVSSMDPAAGATIGANYTLSATIVDVDGIKSVSFQIQYPSGATSSFAAKASGSTWTAGLSGFYDGTWKWRVVAKDNAKPSNTRTTDWVSFSVNTSGGGGGGGGGGNGGGTNANAVGLQEWTNGGAVQTAAGRIYFEMPANKSASRWAGYICSGTVATDTRSGASIIITAAHCVWDDVNKAFARNVMFIPNQAGTTSGRTDLDCTNDPIGCWAPTYGVVDANYTARVFPDNHAWDYAYYIVPDSGAHAGAAASSDVLSTATGTLAVSFASQTAGATTTALGYPGAQDPKFMYCVDGLTDYSNANWYLSGCGLGGGASGGPWSSNGASGPIVSVNSWGWSNGSPGMAGPKLTGTASCLYAKANDGANQPTNRGYVGTCP